MNWHNVALLYLILLTVVSGLIWSHSYMVNRKKYKEVIGMILAAFSLVLATLLVGGVV